MVTGMDGRIEWFSIQLGVPFISASRRARGPFFSAASARCLFIMSDRDMEPSTPVAALLMAARMVLGTDGSTWSRVEAVTIRITNAG